MDLTSNLWWGYEHTNGSFQAKRYFNRGEITDANESPFCAKVVGPFEATSREDALQKVEEKTTGNIKLLIEALGKIRSLKENQGIIECPKCKNNLTYSRRSNGHVWGKCETENCLSWAQ